MFNVETLVGLTEVLFPDVLEWARDYEKPFTRRNMALMALCYLFPREPSLFPDGGVN